MFNIKAMCFLCCVFVIASFMPTSQAETLIGAPQELSGEDLKDAEKKLQTSLTKLAAGDGPHYKLGKIHSASRQIVSGYMYKYKVDLISDDGTVKECEVRIWSQPWLENGIKETYECAGEEKVVKKYSA